MRWTAILLFWLVAGPIVSFEAVAAQPARPTAQSDRAYEGARIGFDALPEAERKTIQEALVWTGDYNGSADGGFGRRTYDAIVAYQKRAQLKPDGVLDAKGSAGLRAAAQSAREAVQFAGVTDPRTGVVIGVPQKILAKREPSPNGGTRWQSADRKITLDTRAFPPAEIELAALFERTVNAPTPGRQVTYKLLRPDFFVVSGETQTGKFYIRYGSGPAGIRGFSLAYEKGIAKDFDRLTIAIANSFMPFLKARPGTAAEAPPPASVPRPPPEPPKSSAPIATGLVVGPGSILTTASVAACADLRAGGTKVRAVRVAEGARLALLELEAPRPLAPPILRAVPIEPGTGVVALIFAASADLAVVPGEAGPNDSLIAPLQPGASGGPVFDRLGALAGVIGAMPTSPRLIGGILPPARYGLVPAGEIARFLSAAGITFATAQAAGERTAGEIAGLASSAVVPIACT